MSPVDPGPPPKPPDPPKGIKRMIKWFAKLFQKNVKKD
jgi:hypothetical protein